MCWTRRSGTARSPRRRFQGWDIPGRYLVFGDPKDLKDLMAKELAEATPVTLEEPAPKKYKDEYIIPGSGFRMLVGDIHNLIVLYYSLARRLSEAETEKDFLRLKKKAGGYEEGAEKALPQPGPPGGQRRRPECSGGVHHPAPQHGPSGGRCGGVPGRGRLEGDEVWSD